MCCALTIDVEVDFSKTIIYAAETFHPHTDWVVHVLGYQNTVQNNVNRDQQNSNQQNYSRKPADFVTRLFNSLGGKSNFDTGLGNAMLLPFPARPGTMSRNNVVDIEDFPYILTDISNATFKGTPSLNPDLHPMPESSFGESPEVDVFEAAGIYTVVLAQNANYIPDALSRVPIEKRPNPNPDIFKAYAKWYPDWTFALCCFNNEDKKEAHPLLWWYEPMFEDRLFLPALDSHDGSVPKLDDQVRVDHTLAVGSKLSSETTFEFCYNYMCIKAWKELGYIGIPTATDFFKHDPPYTPQNEVLPHAKNFKNCPVCGQSLKRRGGENSTYQKVEYGKSERIPEQTKNFLMDQIIGKRFGGEMPNGDFFCDIQDVRNGIFNPIRQSPI